MQRPDPDPTEPSLALAEADFDMKAATLSRDSHPIRAVIDKLFFEDDIGRLATVVSWNILISLVPITVGLVAISGLALAGNPGAQQAVISHLSHALQGVLSPTELHNLVRATTQHAGLLGLIGLAGTLWGGANVGGAISGGFQRIFGVKDRSFANEKLIDIGMIFVFTLLSIVIILATTAVALIKQLFTSFALPGITTLVIGTAISVAAAFLLFASMYLVLPNVQPGLRLRNIWRGALAAAVLFQILSYIWPIYVHFAHFRSHGAILGAITLLMLWIYCLSLTMMLGAEVVAFRVATDEGAH
jgi:membrane protein